MLDLDNESGMDHAQFRQYAEMTGRWSSPDPYGGSYDFTNPQSLNRYAYALNNPLSLIDPTGLAECDPSNYSTSGNQDEAGEYSSADCDNWFALMGGSDPETTYATEENGQFQSTQSTTVAANGPGDCDTSDPMCQMQYQQLMGQIPTGPQFSASSLPSQAPNNATPWYKTCTAEALGKGLGSTALDAIGILPEGGTVSAAFSLFHGAAGISNGTNILRRVAFAGGIISAASAGAELSQTNGTTASSVVTGLQVTAGGFGIAKGLIEDIPVAGQVIAAGATTLDLIGTGLGVAECYGW